MTVTALVLSTLALLVAVVSALYTREQARASRDTARIDTDRRHDELAPKFNATLEQIAHSEPYSKLHLRLDSRTALTAVTVRLMNAPLNLQFTRGIDGIDPTATFPVHTAFAVVHDGIALAPNCVQTWQLEGHEWPAGGLRIEIDAKADDAHWSVSAAVEGPDVGPLTWPS